MTDPRMADGPPGPRRQKEIYQLGAMGRVPPQPIRIEHLERHAREVMPPEVYDYVAGGAGSEDTLRANLDAFRRWRILPRFLRDVERRDLAVEVLGQRLGAPLLLAPVGVQWIIHPGAELAVARAARSVGVPMILSTLSSCTLEDVASALGDTPRWFQLYWPRSDALTASLLRRAEDAGYGAVVVTIDTSYLGWRERDLQHAYLPFLRGKGLANYFSDPAFLASLPASPEDDPAQAVRRYGELFANPTLTWKDLTFLRDHTRLPIVLKGILAADDARLAAEHGVAGIIVSNHGGRQIDGAVAALDALPGVVDAVAGKLPVLFDSGIRHGADVIKALALGALAALVGRPYCYGLAVNGEEGVRDVLANLIAEVDLTLALMGCASIAEVGRDHLVAASGCPPR
jgi:lactate 2-monooxygenase